jgi:hypothetical protein
LVHYLFFFLSFLRERQWRRKRLEWVLLVFENGVFRMEIRFFIYLFYFLLWWPLSLVFSTHSPWQWWLGFLQSPLLLQDSSSIYMS